jgi:hypothetical protein
MEMDSHPARAVEVTIPEMCHKIEELSKRYKHMKLYVIAGECNTSELSVSAIISDRMGMSKVSSCWILTKLTPKVGECSAIISEVELPLSTDCVALFWGC